VTSRSAGQGLANPTVYSGRLYAGLRIGLLGGSFNPAHDGHRFISLEAMKRLKLDAVWWLVSPQNPLKAAKGMASLGERMARADAVARHPRIVVTDIENRLGTRVTVDTLTALAQRFTATRFVWLMGADNLAQIPRWNRWTTIFHSTAVAVFDRPSYSLKALSGQAATRFARHRVPPRKAGRLAALDPPAWTFIVMRRHPASATAIRRRRRANRLFRRNRDEMKD
jgi:nicotinate-nucleotide adenylyltransferase